ncbi:hypothetical protein SDC9_200784 [bioreactor metagenome]|uniref:Uncharacterized protein n=1 Tax=bioreactor metagenome TaxID=1076179 RepID=A0A645IQ26_9ZZZZ
MLGKFGGQGSDVHTIELEAAEGVRYTVPKTVNISRMEDTVKVRFRVGKVFKDSYISVYYDDERVLHRKKIIMAPGEMEDITLDKKKLQEYPDLKKITVKIEKE